MNTALQILHWMAALVVLAEALNKLERTCPFKRGMKAHARLVDGLKAIAWFLMALGAGMSLLALVIKTPIGLVTLLHLERPTLAETASLLGFAVLIVRTRVKEG